MTDAAAPYLTSQVFSNSALIIEEEMDEIVKEMEGDCEVEKKGCKRQENEKSMSCVPEKKKRWACSEN